MSDNIFVVVFVGIMLFALANIVAAMVILMWKMVGDA